MNRLLTCTIAVLLLSGSACGQDQASQLLETAQFEERQTNLTHAKELCQKLANDANTAMPSIANISSAMPAQ